MSLGVCVCACLRGCACVCIGVGVFARVHPSEKALVLFCFVEPNLVIADDDAANKKERQIEGEEKSFKDQQTIINYISRNLRVQLDLGFCKKEQKLGAAWGNNSSAI